MRGEHDSLKDKQDKDSKQLFIEMDNKADKQDLADLETRLLQQLTDMAAQMREMFPDKEAVRKKLREIQDKVSTLLCLILCLLSTLIYFISVD